MSAPQPPYDEPPILIEQLQVASLYHYDESNTSAEERRPLYPEEVWLELALVPSVPPAQTAFPGTLSYPVRGISNVLLAPVPGNAQRFAAATPGQFVDMVPANYSGGAYRPTLRDATGRVVLYSPSVWIADGVRQVVEFQSKTPTQLGLTLPLSISYWRYVGLFPEPGGGGGLTGVDNVGDPGGEVWESTTGNVAHLRRLIPDPTAGRAGTTVETSGQNVRIGTSLTGENLGAGPSSAVFSAKSVAGNLQFRRLTAGANVLLTENANDIVIAASGGGGGGVTGAANLGGGAGVFDGLNVSTLEFRSLTAGPGLVIETDVPAIGEIQISADEATAAGVPVVPDDVEYYINVATGDDAFPGTALQPFATLARAVREVRVVGYNDTATIIVQAAGGPLTLPAGNTGMDFGTRGERNNPVQIRGELASNNVGLAVSAVAADSVTGQQTISVAAPPATPFDMGQIVRFTSGTATGRSFFISDVLSTTSVRIAAAATGVAIADTFDVSTPDSTIQYTTTAWYGGPTSAVLVNLRMVGLAGAASSFITFGLPLDLNGVWWQNLATAGYLRNTDVRVGAGLSTAVEATGAFFDGTAGGTAFLFECQGPTRLAYCVARGNGAESNLKIVGQISQLFTFYALDIGSVEVAEQASAPYAFDSVWLVDSRPGPETAETGDGALSMYSGAAVAATRVRVQGSIRSGISVSSNAALTISTATVTGCASVGYYLLTGAYMTAGASVFAHEGTTGNGSYGVEVTKEGRLFASAALECRYCGTGMAVSLGGQAIIDGALTCSDNVAWGVFMVDGGRLFVDGTLTTTANGSHGLIISQSIVETDAFTSTNNGQTNLIMFNGELEVNDAVTMSDTTDVHIYADCSSIEWCYGPVDIHNSTSVNASIILGNTSLKTNAATFSVHDNSGIGIELLSSSELAVPYGTLDVARNALGGIDAADPNLASNAAINCSVLAASNNGGFGVRMFGGRAYVARGATLSSDVATAVGALYLGHNAAFRCGALTADLPNMPAVVAPAVGAVVYVTDNSSLTVSADAAAGTTGALTATTSSLNAIFAVAAFRGSRIFAEALTATLDLGAAGGIAALRASTSDVRVSGAVTVAGGVINGVFLSLGSTLTSEGVLTISGNGVGLNMQSGSSASTGSISAANAGPNPAFVTAINLQSSRLVAVSAIVLDFWASVGLALDKSEAALSSSLTATNCLSAGVSASASTLRASPLILSGNATGLRAVIGSNVSCILVTASGCTADGINLSQSTLTTSAPVTVDSNTGRGATLVSSTLVVGTVMSASSNGGRNISLEGSTLNVASTITANGSSAAEGLFMSNSTARAAGAVTISSNALNNLKGTNSLFECSSTLASTMSSSGSTSIVLDNSKLQFMGALTTNNNTGSGIDLDFSSIIVNNTLTSKGNTSSGAVVQRSNLDAISLNVGDAGTVGNFNGNHGLSALESTIRVSTTITASNAGIGSGFFVTRCLIVAGSAITANSNATNGLSLTGGSLECHTLVASTNLARGVAVASGGQVAVITNVTVSNNANIGIQLEDGSTMCGGNTGVACTDGFAGIRLIQGSRISLAATLITLGASAIATAGMSIESGSQANIGALTVNSAFTSPIVVTGNSRLWVDGTVLVTRTAATPAALAGAAILIDVGSSAAFNDSVAVSSVTTLTPAVASILVRGGSSAVLAASGNISDGPADGIEATTRSGVNLVGTVAGTGNIGVGLRLSEQSAAHVSGTTSITGAGGNVIVGANAVKTWANIFSGELQHINDFSFPGGGAPTATSVVQMCTCTS
jgi:hypothetical protein